MFARRNVIRNKRQLDSEPPNFLDEETTFHSQANPLEPPTSFSTSTSLLASQQQTKHGWNRRRQRRHRNHPERAQSNSNAANIDQELDSKLTKFASVWSSIIHLGPNSPLQEVGDLEKRGVPVSETDSVSISDIDQAKQGQEQEEPLLLQQQQKKLHELRPLSRHQFTYPASQPDLAPSLALTMSHSRAGSEPSPNNNGEQLIASLQIDSLSSEDNGVYLCRVDFRKARSRTQESVLKIIGNFNIYQYVFL